MFQTLLTFINLFEHRLKGRCTIRLTIFWYIGDSMQVYLMSNHSRQQIVILTTVWWWQI
jgi:hypothetical protein